MTSLRYLLIYIGSVLILLSIPASAQVPPHQPGTVCFTPNFWCWAPQPGPPGAQCACPTPGGWVFGRLG